MAELIPSLGVNQAGFFNDACGQVELIEVSSQGSSRRRLTEQLVHEYVLNDFEVRGYISITLLQLTYCRTVRLGQSRTQLSPLQKR